MSTEQKHTPANHKHWPDPSPTPWTTKDNNRAIIVDANGVSILKGLHMEGYARPIRKDIKKTAHHPYDGEVYKGVDVAMSNVEYVLEIIASAPILLSRNQELEAEIGKLKKEIEEHQLALADAQFQGFYAAKREGNIIRLIEAMGLSKEEWEQWKKKFPTYVVEDELEEINEHFNSEK